MKIGIGAVSIICSIAVIALGVASLCTAWLYFDGRLVGYPRFTTWYHLTKITDQVTQADGTSTQRTVAAFTRMQEIESSGTQEEISEAKVNYKVTASAFGISIGGLFFTLLGLILGCGKKRKAGITGSALLWVATVLFAAATIEFAVTINHWYPFSYYNVTIILSWGLGFWLIFVCSFASLWGATAGTVHAVNMPK